jgi:hypothetical protein
MADERDKRKAQADLAPTDKEAAEVKGGQASTAHRKRKFLRRKGGPAGGGGSANTKPM